MKNDIYHIILVLVYYSVFFVVVKDNYFKIRSDTIQANQDVCISIRVIEKP